MTRHVVIGTAGHVDHGKTALVKALTGVDTDRFPEEQRRGITIDIGFAALPLGADIHASVVDVPGHEDFIRNMVAGATGIDVALLVVAADEGVMPQTVEHLAILELLGVRVGVVAITKTDLVEADWRDLVVGDVEERLRATAIRWEALVPVSVVNGQGIENLRGRLSGAAAQVAERAKNDFFRMPVDRVFSLPGAGTVVTGTTWSGSVRVGDHVSILPEGGTGRVRSVEVHGERKDAAEPGRRTALALAGLERDSAKRGSVVVSDPSWRPSVSIDASISLLSSAPRPISQRTRVRLHLGTAEVLARVTPADGDILPGASGMARLRLETPVVARWGDRGVLRAYSPVTTIGGCVIVDPWPSTRPRRPVVDVRRAAPDQAERIRALVEASGADGIAIADLPVRAGVAAGELEPVVAAAAASGDMLRLTNRLVAATAMEKLRSTALSALAEEHRRRPLATGMPLELLRQALRSVTTAEHVLEDLERNCRIVMEGGTARLASHVASLTARQEEQGQLLLASLTRAGSEGQTMEDLEKALGTGSARSLVEYYVRQGTVVRVGGERYYDRLVLERLTKSALLEIQRLDGATPAQLRDKLQLTRKYLIPLLEWLDLKGFTIRSDDIRKVTLAGYQYLEGS